MKVQQHDVLDANSEFVLRDGIFAVRSVLMDRPEAQLIKTRKLKLGDGLTTFHSLPCIQRHSNSGHLLLNLNYKRNLRFLQKSERKLHSLRNQRW